jgi:hypothetical protein
LIVVTAEPDQLSVRSAVIESLKEAGGTKEKGAVLR